MIEALGVLSTWTPFLLGGLGVNVLITLGAMAIGTTIGGLFAIARLSNIAWIARGGRAMTSLFQNIPSLVLLFYAASVIPHEVVLASGTVLEFPAWLKACLALAGPLESCLTTASKHWRHGVTGSSVRRCCSCPPGP